MKFYREPKPEKNPDGTKYSVYMENDGRTHYVCDMTDGTDLEATAANTLGLTLRARLTRSKGDFAMLEGDVFDPARLLKSVCSITEHTLEPFKGGVYKDGYTLLTIRADGCVNKYLIFSERRLKDLVDSIKAKLKSK